MGCGASAKVEPEPAAGPKPLTQEEIEAIAVQGLKDALCLAVEYGVETGGSVELWKQDAYRIRTPTQADIEKSLTDIIEKDYGTMGKIPMIPIIKLCEEMLAQIKDLSEMFGDAAMTVIKHPGFKASYERIIRELGVQKALELCRTAGVTGCTEYLEDTARDKILQGVTRVVTESLETHKLPVAWKKFSEGWNKLAELASKMSIPLPTADLDLPDFVAQETLKAFKTLMMEKEREIRKAPGAAVSEAVRQVFGQTKPEDWKRS